MKLLLKSLIITFLLNGCGIYTFTGHGIGGIETIAIEPFENQTSEFGIREDLTDAILDALLRDRTLDVTNRGSADAILYGRIISVDDLPLSYTKDEVVTEYEIRITVAFSLMRADQSEPLWEGRISGEGSYPYQSGSLEERQEGINKALERLVQDLINRMTSDW